MAPRESCTALPALATVVAAAAFVGIKLSAASAAVAGVAVTATTATIAVRTAEPSQHAQGLLLRPARLWPAVPPLQPRLYSRRPRLTVATSPPLRRPSSPKQSADVTPIGDRSPSSSSNIADDADVTDYYVQLVSTAVELAALAPCLVGNLLIVASFARFRRLRTRVNALVVNLAVADLLVGLIAVPFNAVYAFSRDLLWRDERLCLALNAGYALCFGGSLSAMLLVSTDRYCAVSFPFFYGERLSRALVGAAVCLVWSTLVAVAAAPPLASAIAADAAAAAGQRSPWQERCEYALIYPDVYKITMATVVACEVAANVGMYLLVARVALRQQQRICSAAARVGACPAGSVIYGGDSSPSLRRELGAARSTLVTNGLFIVCWSPYVATIILMGSNLCGGDACSTAYRLTLSLGIINSCANGVLCSCKKKDFRWAIRRLLRVDASSDRRRRGSRLSVTAAVAATGAGAGCVTTLGQPPPQPGGVGGDGGGISGSFARMTACLRFRNWRANGTAVPTP